MNYYEFEDLSHEEQKQITLARQKKKEKQQKMLVALLLVGGLAFYFLVYITDKRKEAKEKIAEAFRDNSSVQPAMLLAKKADGTFVNQLWSGAEKWEKYLDTLFLTSQLDDFVKKITKAIKKKAKELAEEEGDRPRKLKEEALENIKKACKDEELEIPNIQKIIKDYEGKINNSPINNISSLEKEAGELIVQERVKRQGLHWKRKQSRQSWADKWLIDNIQSFEQAWSKMTDIMKREPDRFNIAASYKIKFPPSLWNNLTDEQKHHRKAEELILGDDVPTYKFSSLIEEWHDKTITDPIRKERDPITKLDNNALFYGAPRTGKSVMAEIITHKANKYPLIAIQGSSLTPRDLDYRSGIDPLTKFIFTLCDIDHTLVDDFGFQREENGEVRYILFLDEANQITTSTMISKSTELTFLKECMGSDNRINESQNLWIAATNHLNQINVAVYQPGRLSNPLDFSWTLGDFIKYATDAGIANQFPSRWMEVQTLNDEDNKWVNRFNKMHFDNKFLPFWRKFIDNNPDAQYEPEKDETNNNDEENENNGESKKIKIKWGEMFEFFWRLFDSKQLEHFQGKFVTPQKPRIEQVVEKTLTLAANQISKSINTRLKELIETAEEIKEQAQESRGNCTSAIEDGLEAIRNIVSQIN